MKIGITGKNGFLGSYLTNWVHAQKADSELIPFERGYFLDQRLEDFVLSCDVIVHFAALNRHPDPQELYDTNVGLVQKLINAAEKVGSKVKFIFASSTQEVFDNEYGKSKREGKRLFEEHARKNGSALTTLIIPNIFGPFCKPNYNSFIATFAYKIINGEVVDVSNDREIELLSAQELTELIYQEAHRNEAEIKTQYFEHTHKFTVVGVLDKFKEFKTLYIENNTIPNLSNFSDLCLFNTFKSYVPHEINPISLKKNVDQRGAFVELIRASSFGQTSFSTTVPGITRGNHYHTRKVERFMVIKGKARISYRKINTEKVYSFDVDGDNPSYVDMPIWFTHNITNIGSEELLTVFWINEPFDPADADTYFEEV